MLQFRFCTKHKRDGESNRLNGATKTDNYNVCLRLEADMDNDYGLGLLFYAERTLRRRMSAYRRQAEVFMGRAGGAVLTQLRNC